LTTVTVGIVIQPARWYVEEGGVAALRGINIRPGHVDLSDLARISEEGHRANAKSRLHEGDIVVVRTGDAGAAVVVPPSLDGANCIDLLIIRKSQDLDSEFLRFVLNSGWAKEQITRGSVGSIQSHFNVESLRELPVPRAPLDVQRSLRQRLEAESMRVKRIVSKLRCQIDLLAEHRQALITAAVTGRIELPGPRSVVSQTSKGWAWPLAEPRSAIAINYAKEYLRIAGGMRWRG
jgi:type I restriction enzyme S subunit